MEIAITIRNCDGLESTLHMPENWRDMTPVFKVLAIHEASRSFTQGRPFAVLKVSK
jgi:hypothetical protein